MFRARGTSITSAAICGLQLAGTDLETIGVQFVRTSLCRAHQISTVARSCQRDFHKKCMNASRKQEAHSTQNISAPYRLQKAELSYEKVDLPFFRKVHFNLSEVCFLFLCTATSCHLALTHSVLLYFVLKEYANKK